MQLISEQSSIVQKTKELCQAILEHPHYQSLRKQVDAFFSDENAKSHYQRVSEQGEYLQHKQQQGLALTDDEIDQFERDRESLLKNPVARGFLDAQQEIHKVQQSVGQFVSKTFELGRVPAQTDFEEGSCGSHSCGCSH